MTGERSSAPASLMRALPAAAAARVRIQIFPLAAEPEQLDDFCTRWFNSKVPVEAAFFRPALPVVFCTVLTYEDMGDDFRWRTGVLSQDELYFLIVLERYRWQNGRLQFVEYGVTTPFIFVNSAESVAYGRVTFGFPKESCEFRPGSPQNQVGWTPAGKELLTVLTWQPTKAGRELQPLATISAFQKKLRPGFDTGASVAVPRAGSSTRSDILWWLQALWGELRARSRPGLIAAAPSVLDSISQTLLNGFTISCYNLRQIPHPYYRDRTLYRDLVNFRLRLRGIQNLRFYSEIASNDTYAVFIRRRGILPIVERLGLRVTQRSQYPERSGAEVVDELPAILPAVAQADVILESSKRLTWQFEGRPWRTGELKPNRKSDEHVTKPPLFDDYLGASASLLLTEEQPLPRRDLKFMMLAANTQDVVEYMQPMIATRTGLNITPLSNNGWTPLRMFWAQNRLHSADRIEGLTWQGGRYVSFTIPITYDHQGERKSAVMLLHDFSDNPFNIQVSLSMFASDSHQAWFSGPRDGWFSTTQGVSQLQLVRTTLLRRRTQEARFEVLPWLDVISDRRSETMASPPVSPELLEAFQQDIVGVHPVMVFGGVPDPADPLRWVERRCTLITYDIEWLEPLVPAAADRRYWLRILSTRDYPLVSGLGLKTDSSVRLEMPTKRDLASGRIDQVPIVGLFEGAARYKARSIDILWSRRGSSPRSYRGVGLGVPLSSG